MFCVEIGEEYRISERSTSDGQQNKFYKDGVWYKENTSGNEGFVEEIVSVLLACSSLNPKDYVEYEAGVINHANGCRSKNFLHSGESFITLYRFYEMLKGEKLNEVLRDMETPEQRADFVLNFFEKNAGLNLTDYFRKIFTVDLFTLNEDRHLNNLGIIEQRDGTYRHAPIFDNGKSLFVGNYSVRRGKSFEENRKRISAKPFAASCDRQYQMFPCGFTVDFVRCRERLHQLPEEICDSEPFAVMLQSLDYIQRHLPELDIPCSRRIKI